MDYNKNFYFPISLLNNKYKNMSTKENIFNWKIIFVTGW